MLFQTLDDKNECVGIYSEKKLQFESIPQNLSKTWSYSPYLKGIDIEYAKIYCESKNLDEVCPEELKEEFKNITKKLQSFKKSFELSKISFNDHCFYDLIPKKFLIDLCEIKNKITEHVLTTYKKPEEYEFFRRFNEILIDIYYRPLNINLEAMKESIAKDKHINHYRKLLNLEKNISYNLFGSITGRLSTNKNSFPILNYPKTFRNVIEPHNDWFVSFDMNAAELRTSLALIEKEQPDEDLYEMLRRDVFKEKFTRTQCKEAATSWLYNSSNPVGQEYAEGLDSVFEKETLLNTHWDGKYVYTPFSRKIESDKFHAIPYLNQSTFIDLFHRQAIKVDDYLQNKKSFIAFFLHDEFVIDLSDEDRQNLPDIINLLQNTEFGKYIVNVKAGKNYGDMKKLKLKV